MARIRLTECTQRVVVNGTVPTNLLLKYEVHQGSVLDPSLLTMYTYPLSVAMQPTGIYTTSLGDDSQLYNSSVELLPGRATGLFGRSSR